jgi:phytoene synthase
MQALYAFCREVDDVVDECSDPTVAGMTLAWWQQEIRWLAEGSDRAQHPISRALAPAMVAYQLPLEDLQAILDGVGSDLHPLPLPHFEALDLYCDRVAGAVGRLSARIFGGGAEPRVQRYATRLGLALQYTNIFRDIGDDARKGRVYLPESLLREHRVSRADILYDEALDTLPGSARWQQRPGLVMAAVYRDLLRALEEDPLAVLNHRVSVGPGRKMLLGLRAALGIPPR